MRVALIPPRGMEQYIFQTNTQMMLRQLNYTGYAEAYDSAKKRGDFIMLDNGAAEGVAIPTAERLFILAGRYGVDELVVPDVLRDARGTIRAVASFFIDAAQLPQPYTNGLQLMAVAQGNNLREAMACVQAFTEHPEITTVGIPRLLMEPLYKAIRIDLANRIETIHPGRFKIHLLGMNTIWPQEIRAAARYAPHIRSVDSSLPFVLAINDIALSANTQTDVTRPDNYFKDTSRPHNPKLVIDNIHTLLNWAANAKASVG